MEQADKPYIEFDSSPIQIESATGKLEDDITEIWEGYESVYSYHRRFGEQVTRALEATKGQLIALDNPEDCREISESAWVSGTSRHDR